MSKRLFAKAKKDLHSAFHQKKNGLRVLYAYKGELIEIIQLQGSSALCNFNGVKGWVSTDDLEFI